jgi:hypothetical protein
MLALNNSDEPSRAIGAACFFPRKVAMFSGLTELNFTTFFSLAM